MNIDNHPCFNPKACHSHGRVHLPVAPRCNIQCNFCNRKFDCVNESRPGVTSGILTPFQAMDYLDEVFRKKLTISVVGIAGPGDPFANPEQTLKTLEMVRHRYPDMLLCVATNGLNLPPWLDDIQRIGVSHISVTVNAVDPEIGARVYSWVRHGRKLLGPEKGAEILLERQLESIRGLKERGIIVKVNTIVLPGINDHHVEAIAACMGRFGVDILNCMPYYPNAGSNLGHLPEPSKQSIAAIRETAGRYIPQMLHCRRCRADAVGLLGDPDDIGLMNRLKDCSSRIPADGTATGAPETEGPGYVAVASREGVLVNQHLGEASYIYIYEVDHGEAKLMERRKAPDPGGGELRWMEMASLLADCRTLLVSGIGSSPRQVLSRNGMEILEVNGLIDDIVPRVVSGLAINHLLKREKTQCQMSCSGSGTGCM
ncbi:MAG: nitrogenase cofactor biosynthesis protein NifB [Pseudomonadota bacterium]